MRMKKALTRLMDLAAGSYSQWYRRLLPLCGSWKRDQLEERIARERRRTLRRYGICLGIMTVLFCASLMNSPKEGGEKTLFLEYGSVRQEIRAGQMKEKEEGMINDEVLLEEARVGISREMLGNNESWDQISGPLVFPQQLESGVFVRYETSNPRRISITGQVDGIGTGDGEDVTIRVTMLLRDSVSRFTLHGTVVPPRTEEEKVQALRLRAANVEAALSEPADEKEILEAQRRDGIQITEEFDKSQPWLIVFVASILMVVSFLGKFREVDRKAEDRRRALAEQLPLLTEQLILMMNAGLILSEALQMAAETFPEEEQKQGGQLFQDVRMLCERAAETRRPVTLLLCEYAMETGVAEMVRFSAMLADHVSRGSASLVQQLKTERNYAVERQWKQKEGRCREMEVRLAGPLFLLLAVILVLATGPVWIEM